MLYEDYEKLLLKIAHKFKCFGIEFDDLMGIANESFVQACNDYQEEEGKVFSTYLYCRVRNSIIIEIRNIQRRRQELNWEGFMKSEIEGLFFDDSINVERRICFRDQLKSLSNEAQEVIKTILRSPSELLKETNSTLPRKIRGQLRKQLTDRNWSNRKIAKTFLEIKETINDRSYN